MKKNERMVSKIELEDEIIKSLFYGCKNGMNRKKRKKKKRESFVWNELEVSARGRGLRSRVENEMEWEK